MATKKAHVPVSSVELKLILRSYCAHPADWDTIIEEMKINSCFLPNSASNLYMDGDIKKLRRRMNDRVTKLLHTDIDSVDEELREYVKLIKEISRKYSKKGVPEIRKNQENAQKSKEPAAAKSRSSPPSPSPTTSSVSVPSTSSSAPPSPPSSSGKKRPTDASRSSPIKRRRFVEIQSSRSSEDDDGSQPKRMSNSELAREANKLYIDFASKTLPKMYEKMSKCMDKYLKD